MEVAFSPQAIVLVIDRLQAAMIGPYGNTWIETPGFNQMAALGVTCDQVFVDSLELRSLYRAFWQNQHAAAPGSKSESAHPSLPQRLRQSGVRTVLITDEPWLAESSYREDFDEILVVESPLAIEPAESPEETHLAQFFATVIQWLQEQAATNQLDKPFLLWAHTQGLGAAWDAPESYRQRYADEEDPEPPSFVEVPERLLPEDVDPDEILGTVHAYAGQVTLLDECLSIFHSALDDLQPHSQNWLKALISARGFSLGEHGVIGTQQQIPYNELTQTPWLIQFPQQKFQSERIPTLLQPNDLGVSLAHYFLGSYNTDSAEETVISSTSATLVGRNVFELLEPGCSTDHTGRNYVVTVSSGFENWAIQTAEWKFLALNVVATPNPSQALEFAPPRLYVKPDDRFEINEISNRCEEQVEEFTNLLQALYNERS